MLPAGIQLQHCHIKKKKPSVQQRRAGGDSWSCTLSNRTEGNKILRLYCDTKVAYLKIFNLKSSPSGLAELTHAAKPKSEPFIIYVKTVEKKPHTDILKLGE